MDLSRRQLFKFGAAAVLSAVVAPAAFGTSAPVLWGDGIHDDTEALQAAMDGEDFIADGKRVNVAEGFTVTGGIFRLTDTLHLRKAHKLPCVINDSELVIEHEGFGVEIHNGGENFVLLNSSVRRVDPRFFGGGGIKMHALPFR